jgi:hypothetical protein
MDEALPPYREFKNKIKSKPLLDFLIFFLFFFHLAFLLLLHLHHTN